MTARRERRRSIVRPLILVCLAATVAAAEPRRAGRDAGPATHRFFPDAPVRLAPVRISLPGRPHPYSPLMGAVGFRDGRGLTWIAPDATLTDGASIPPVFVPLIGAPRSDGFLAAAALHDAQCGAGNEGLPQFHARGWEETHRMFHDALLAGGVGATRAKIMFAAVYLGGPRWDDPARSLDGVSEARLLAEMEACLAFIRSEDPTLAELEAWMRDREGGLIATAPDRVGP